MPLVALDKRGHREKPCSLQLGIQPEGREIREKGTVGGGSSYVVMDRDGSMDHGTIERIYI